MVLTIYDCEAIDCPYLNVFNVSCMYGYASVRDCARLQKQVELARQAEEAALASLKVKDGRR